jgi:hypothetical protein
MKFRTHIKIYVFVFLIHWIVTPFSTNGYGASLKHKIAEDPSNATYILDGKYMRLRDGYFEVSAAPGSATKIRVSIIAEPVYGDIDKDGDKDAVMFLVFKPGGSATFYYVAAAIKTKAGFYGTTAALLGDRIKPLNLNIYNGMVVATYADRSPSQPMAAVPLIEKSTYMVFDEDQLVLHPGVGEKDKLFSGWVTIGHEVRSFRSCSPGPELWLSGQSPAIERIKIEYRKKMKRSDHPYTPLFMILTGQIVEPPDQGFGTNYPGALHASQLIEARTKGGCDKNLIVVYTPQPGVYISSPLQITGRARGTWFFEGDFPVILYNAGNTIISQGYCTAKGDWMTEQVVPFEGTLIFDKRNKSEPGFLMLKKDNPTGNTQFDDSLPIPVILK